MIRFLRQNAEIITSVCVVLSLIIGGSFLYQSQQAQQAGQAELDAIVSQEQKAPAADRESPAAPAAAAPESSGPAAPAAQP